MTETTTIPEGFALTKRKSNFIDLLGPVYEAGNRLEYRMGLRLVTKHANLVGTGHGGVLCTLLDVYLGRLVAYNADPPSGFITVSLTADFMSAAPIGNWLEVHGRIDRTGKRLAYSSGVVTANGKPVARGSGIFQMMEKH